LNAKVERTRRNILRMGAIAASGIVTLASTKRGAAKSNGDGDGHGHDPDGHGRDPGGSCFLRGTTIRTASGSRKVEELAIGDLLPTMFGGYRPIQWVARYRFTKSDPSKPWVKAVRPIRVARSTLAPDVPHTDLYLTEWHSLFVDGVLIPVGSLINGTTIKLDDA
jgi:hypothetical protein